MKNLTLAGLSLAIFAGCASNPAKLLDGSNTAPVAQQQQALHAYYSSIAEEHELSHLGVAVWRAGETLIAEDVVTGQTDLGFQIGSLHKSFTAIAVLTAVEDGHIDLDAPVSRYVPNLNLRANGEHQITTRQLLSHTAGVPDMIGHPINSTTLDAAHLGLYRQIPDALQNMPLSFEPGTSSAYSNMGFSLSALVLENATGRDYHTYMHEEVFEPMGLEYAQNYAGEKSGEKAGENGIYKVATTTIDGKDLLPLQGAVGPSGTMVLTPSDMAKVFAEYDRFYRGTSKLLTPESVEQLTTANQFDMRYQAPHNYAMGLGLEINDNPNTALAERQLRNVWAHTGGLPPANSYMIYYPESRVGVFSSTLAHSQGSESLLEDALFGPSREVLARYGDKSSEKIITLPYKHIDRSAIAPQDLVGVYAMGLGLQTQIFVDDGELFTTFMGRDFKLKPLDTNQYEFGIKLLGLVLQLDAYQIDENIYLEVKTPDAGYFATLSHYPAATLAAIPNAYQGNYQALPAAGKRLQRWGLPTSFNVATLPIGTEQATTTQFSNGDEIMFYTTTNQFGDLVSTGHDRNVGEVIEHWQEDADYYIRYEGGTYKKQ